jgi:uncharacterized protein (TIRG00374 family)
MDAPTSPAARAGAARTTWRWLRTVGGLVLVVAALEYGVVPQLVSAAGDLTLFKDMSLPLLCLALALEAMSLVSYTCLTQRLLRPAATLSFVTQLRIDLTGYGLSHVAPGGGATAAAVRYRLMVARGTPPASALTLAGLEAVLAIAGLVLVWLLASLISLPRTGVTMTFLLLTLVASLVALCVAYLESAPGGDPTRGLLARVSKAAPSRFRARVTAVLRRGKETMRDPRALAGGLAWSSTNWLLDAACLWVCLRAYGVDLAPELMLLTYGVACTVGQLPVTPGGLGVIEGLMVPGLVAAGAPAATAVLGVLTWRLLQYWGPIPLAGACWLSLVGPRAILTSGVRSL